MTAPTWIIIGANSAIAEEFAKLAAEAQHPLILSGRDGAQLNIIAADLRIRYHSCCDVLPCDLAEDISPLIKLMQDGEQEFALFIAAGHIVENDQLTPEQIGALIHVNILGISQLIHAWIQKKQASHRLIYLSSVAACRGRNKNSLYGASKAAIELYLQGLQQTPDTSVNLSIARLGFIDTVQTWGMPGIFYAASPQSCAKACWNASKAGRRLIYFPFFWRYIMAVITRLPLFVYRRMAI